MRIKDYINQRLNDPLLSPAQVAAAFGISTRYLHKLFESEPETVTHYIRGSAGRAVPAAAAGPPVLQRPISALAFDAGFNDLSGFNRAFKAKYGRSPRQLRATAQHTASSCGMCDSALVSRVRAACRRRPPDDVGAAPRAARAPRRPRSPPG